MDISIEHTQNALIITMTGSLDALSAPHMDKTMQQAFENSVPPKCIFCMEGVDYISSAGLRSVLGVAKTMRKIKGQLIFVGLVPTVKEVFDMSGFSSYFKEFENLEAAMASSM